MTIALADHEPPENGRKIVFVPGSDSDRTIWTTYPWARAIAQHQGGWLVFESYDDVEAWLRANKLRVFI